MRALWLDRQQLSYLEDVPVPARTGDEVRVRVLLAGICGTDLAILRGYYPYAGIPGHEFVGAVVDAADASLIGRRVVGEINVSCGQCEPCRRGWPTHCESRIVLGIRGRNGAFADYLALPRDRLHLVPDSVPDEAAVFAEPLAAALEIQAQVRIRPDDRVLLIGGGRLGQLIARTLHLTGCELMVVARYPVQRQHLAQMGILCLDEADPIPRHFDIVIEATGSPQGFDCARRAVRPRGTVILKSTYPGQFAMDVSSVVVDEVTLVGSRCGPFPAALRLLEQRLVDPTPLIAARYPLNQGLEAFRIAAQPGTLKVLLVP